MMYTDSITRRLFALKDESYSQFQSRLIPTLASEKIIGVRTPALRKFAKQIKKEEQLQEFLSALPHFYLEENILHGFIISEIKDFEECVEALEIFLPYMDNWAVCDQCRPRIFRQNHLKLEPILEKWLSANHTYTARFAVEAYMTEFLDVDFRKSQLELIANKEAKDYYLKMMIAWYFATALAKQYEAAIPFIENRYLEPWIHKKTIQKAIESYRISEDQKKFLRTLR